MGEGVLFSNGTYHTSNTLRLQHFRTFASWIPNKKIIVAQGAIPRNLEAFLFTESPVAFLLFAKLDVQESEYTLYVPTLEHLSLSK